MPTKNRIQKLKDKFKPLRVILEETVCPCGKVTDSHCRSFRDSVWFGCLRNKPIIEERIEK